MEVCGQLHASPSLPPRKDLAVSTQDKVGRPPEPGWTLWSTEKSLPLTISGTLFLDHSFCIPVTKPTEIPQFPLSAYLAAYNCSVFLRPGTSTGILR